MARQTVSRQIASLEQELGCALFFRTTTALELTPEGQRYYLFFSYAKNEYYRVRKIVSERRGDYMSVIRIGCIYGIDLQPTFMDLLRKGIGDNSDNVDLQWRYMDHEKLESCLMDGEIDAAIVNRLDMFSPDEMLGYESIPFETVQPMVVMHRKYYEKYMSSAFYHRASCCLSDEDVEEDVDVKLSFQTLWKKLSGITLENLQILPNWESVQHMIQQANGFTVTTNYNEMLKNDEMMAFPFGPPIKLMAIWRSGNPNAGIQVMLHMLRNGSIR